MKRLASHWPAVIWSVVLIAAPLVLRAIHLDPPGFVAVPVGVVSPVCAAVWRVKR